jgi:exodeoxyribonuclease V alpha subunit
MTLVLDPSQERAVELAVSAPIACLTGGPGTGKSTIVRTLLERSKGWTLLASPTGKAAKRLAETTGRAASTIHRLLSYGPCELTGQLRFRIDRNCPLEADLVVIDEASMLDIELADALLDAVQGETRLLLVGDANQLPSVGPGRVFADLIESGTVPVARLEHVHRSAAESWVCSQAPAILRGAAPDLRERADFAWVESVSRDDLVRNAIASALGVHEETGALPPVLIPQNTGPAGVEAINACVQVRVNPPRPGERVHGKAPFELRPRDPVIQTKNDYTLGVFNGEIGIVVHVDDTQRVHVALDDRTVVYSKSQATKLRLAYALTIHKSQGSEWPWIVVVCHSTHSYMLSRQLLYTGITRAKKGVVLVGDKTGLDRALANTAPEKRNTGLVERLRGAA